MSVKEGTAIFKDDKIVAFVPNDGTEVTFIEGFNKLATVSAKLVFYVIDHLQSLSEKANEDEG